MLEVTKLCLAREHRRGLLMRRICEDVHVELVGAGRAWIAIAAPDWLLRRYRFIGFSRTGIRCPIPGINVGSLELMLSKQKRFGTYGLHVDPLRWNLFLREPTDQLLASGRLRLNRRQRAALRVYRLFWPAALIARFAWKL